MDVLWDMTSVRRFEIFSAFLGSFCVEQYPFQVSEGINLLKSPECVMKILTLKAK